jgi:Holliday junction resolvase RusA-like endonuclease
MEIFIPQNVPSSKNNRVWTGRYFIESKRVKEYRKQVKEYFINNREQFIQALNGKEKPYIIGFHFIRNNKHKWDYINMLQIVQDLMVEYKWIDDDNTNEMFPLPYKIKGKYYSVDKEKPGIIISIL